VCDSPSLLISPRGTAIITDIIRLPDIVSDSQSTSISLLRVVDGDFSRMTTFRKDAQKCNVRAPCEEVPMSILLHFHSISLHFEPRRKQTVIRLCSNNRKWFHDVLCGDHFDKPEIY
jgi:hypothetical protein